MRSTSTTTTRLSVWSDLPFGQEHWVLFFKNQRLEALKLHDVELEDLQSCRAIALADIQELVLDRSQLEDGGAALIAEVAAGQGTSELVFRSWRHNQLVPFQMLERWESFMNALRSDRSRLERLEIICRIVRAVAQASRDFV